MSNKKNVSNSKNSDGKYDHLNKETIPYLSKSIKQKIKWIDLEHFILYPQAQKIINKLIDIVNQGIAIKESLVGLTLEEKLSKLEKLRQDLYSLSIIGESGTGKTAIINYFRSQFDKIDKGEYDCFPVVYTVCSDISHGVKALYKRILKPFPMPNGRNREILDDYTKEKLETMCIHILLGAEVATLIIDEIQNVIGTKKQTKSILNSLKVLTQDTLVPLVLIGTIETLEVLLLDDQIGRRCAPTSYSILKPWKNDGALQVFLTNFEKYLPFPKPSNLGKQEMTSAIFKLAVKKSLLSRKQAEKIFPTDQSEQINTGIANQSNKNVK